MRIVGLLALAAAFGSAVLCPVGVAVFRRRRIGDILGTVSCISVLLAAAVLLYLLISGDFTAEYVYKNTELGLPLIYRISAFWSSSAGSMLLWLVCSSAIYLILKLFRSRRKTLNRGFFNCLSVTVSAVSFLFLVFILFINNPFRYAGANSDGLGLNPTLQSLGMVVHPPLVMISYSLLFVAFAAALYEAVYGDGAEMKTGESFSLLGWIFLTMGIVSGGIWAYTELGWGGYWSWDAIENSAFVTWLLTSAYIHLYRLRLKGSIGARPMFVLMAATIFSLLFGTFLARSGVIESVHSYSNQSATVFFAVLLAVVIVICAAILIFARRKKTREKAEKKSHFPESIPSLWMILCALIIGFMTISPLLPVRPEIDENTYNIVFGIGGTLLLVMMTAFFSLRGTTKGRGIICALVALAAAAAVLVLPGFSSLRTLTRILLALNIFSFTGMCVGFLLNTGKFLGSMHSFVMFLLHVSLAVTAIGLIGSRGMKTELTYILEPDDVFYLQDHTVEYGSFRLEENESGKKWIFDLSHSVKGAEREAEISMSLSRKSGIYTSQPYVFRTTEEDFFLIAENADDSGGLLLKVIISKWVSFLWAGIGLMLLSAIYGYFRKLRQGKKVNIYAKGDA